MNEVESQAHNLKLFIVSDSIGETAQRMIHATLTQFPDLNNVEIKNFLILKMRKNFKYIKFSERTQRNSSYDISK